MLARRAVLIALLFMMFWTIEVKKNVCGQTHGLVSLVDFYSSFVVAATTIVLCRLIKQVFMLL